MWNCTNTIAAIVIQQKPNASSPVSHSLSPTRLAFQHKIEVNAIGIITSRFLQNNFSDVVLNDRIGFVTKFHEPENIMCVYI